jgi:hypothetical protein
MAATRLISRTLLAATTVAGAALTPAAHAAPTAPAAPPHEVTFMNLSVQPEQARDARTAVLTCDPAGGTHPNAAAACQTLATANGDFQALPTAHSNVVCPQIYKPVVFTARGTWHDKPVQFQKKFANACQASAQTGQVFQF